MRGRDLVAAIVAPVVWGLSFIAIKYGVEEAPPFLLTALRFAFAALPFAISSSRRRRRRGSSSCMAL